MTTADRADQASSIPTSRKVLCVVYGVIAVAALIGTWSQGGPYIHSATDFFINFLRDARVIPASRIVTVDLVMLFLAAAILMVTEARKHNVRFVWAYIVGSLFVPASVAFALFLIARELRMGTSGEARLHTTDTILLAVLAVAATGLSIWIDIG